MPWGMKPSLENSSSGRSMTPSYAVRSGRPSDHFKGQAAGTRDSELLDTVVFNVLGVAGATKELSGAPSPYEPVVPATASPSFP